MAGRGQATVSPLRQEEPREAFDFVPASKYIVFQGITYTFRELTVAENDECRDLATDKDGNYDGRTHMRMMICTGSVEPKIDPEQLTKFPQRLYGKILELVAELNDESTIETEGNG